MKNRITPEPSRRDRPAKDPNILWVECPEANTSSRFVIYSPQHMGMEMHWFPEQHRTVPCFEDHSLCPGGHNPNTVKWRAYLHAHSERRDEAVFLQLTDEAMKSWLKKLRPGVTLRGQIITVHRTTKKNGRLWVEVNETMVHGLGKLPEPMDCKLSCWKLWRFRPDGAQLNANLSPGPGKATNGVFLG
jgi:hypothetical protein